MRSRLSWAAHAAAGARAGPQPTPGALQERRRAARRRAPAGPPPAARPPPLSSDRPPPSLPPAQASTSRRWSTRTSPSPSGTWEARTRCVGALWRRGAGGGGRRAGARFLAAAAPSPLRRAFSRYNKTLRLTHTPPPPTPTPTPTPTPADPPALAPLLPEHAGPDLRRRLKRPRPRRRGARRAAPDARRGRAPRRGAPRLCQQAGACWLCGWGWCGVRGV
jgi:hypothetical protein